MGSYAIFSIDDYQLLSSRGAMDAVVMMIFTEAEKRIRQEKFSEMDPAGSRILNELETNGLHTVVEYVASGTVVLDRLEAMGFTLAATRKFYAMEHARRVSELEEWDTEPVGGIYLFHEEVAFLRHLDFDSWVRHFREMKERNVHHWDLTLAADSPVVLNLSPQEKFFLTDDDFFFRFPPCDLRYLVRAVIEACGSDSCFSVDVSDLVNSGYNDANDSIAKNARDELTLDYPLNTKVIVLTEGVTDRRFLEASLQLLYPHLSEYYVFMDFDGASVPGGAGHLVNTVKAFAGAGVSNRVIALFDNDTAARSALRGLDSVRLPQSMRILQYPPIAIASKYPTAGPSGLVQMDVNCSAGSLEIYFGVDILRGSDGTLTPVHWRGFDQSIRAYQGEVEKKGELHDKFARKVAAARKDSSLVQAQDWSGMRAILDVIRHVFENEVR